MKINLNPIVKVKNSRVISVITVIVIMVIAVTLFYFSIQTQTNSDMVSSTTIITNQTVNTSATQIIPNLNLVYIVYNSYLIVDGIQTYLLWLFLAILLYFILTTSKQKHKIISSLLLLVFITTIMVFVFYVVLTSIPYT